MLTGLNDTGICVIVTPSSHYELAYSIHALDGIVYRVAKWAGQPPESSREVQAACRIAHARCAEMAL
jgi:hypothetical protein